MPENRPEADGELPAQPVVKVTWTKPVVEEMDIGATRAGGAVIADQDPNRPS